MPGCAYDAMVPGRGELWAWRVVPCADGDPQIAVTPDEVAVRSGRHPDDVAVFTRAEWKALAVHITDREDA